MTALPAWVAPDDLQPLDLASAQLQAWSMGLGDELRAAFDGMVATTGANASAGARPYLLPISQPVVLLPLWLSRALPQQTRVDLVGSALAGYLAVRVQDDWVDRRCGDAEVAMVLSAALAGRHAALVGRHAVGEAYWHLHAERWSKYATAMALERQLAAGVGPYTEAEFQRVLDRSRPVILPGAAALALSGRWSVLPRLSAMVDCIVAAHQRFDDLRDGLDDLRAGLRTPVLARSGARSAGAWLGWLAADGARDELALAAAELETASQCAQQLSLPDAEPWLLARSDAMQAWTANWRKGPLAALMATAEMD